MKRRSKVYARQEIINWVVSLQSRPRVGESDEVIVNRGQKGQLAKGEWKPVKELICKGGGKMVPIRSHAKSHDLF